MKKKKYVKPEVVKIPVDYKRMEVRTGCPGQGPIEFCPDVVDECPSYRGRGCSTYTGGCYFVS